MQGRAGWKTRRGYKFPGHTIGLGRMQIFLRLAQVLDLYLTR